MRTAKTISCVALLICTLVACSGTDSTAQSPTSPVSPGTPAPPTMKEQIKALEDSGKLPKLDRSTSIAGPDTNNNGIRDDIDAWIAALPITDVQKKAAQQAARVRQAELLVDLTNKSELNRLGEVSFRSVNCLGDIFKPDLQDGLDLSSQIVAVTANTKERAKQYIAYNRAVSGSSGSLPRGNTCDP
jgi:hypothetical protein